MDNQIPSYINLLRKYEKMPKPEEVLPTFMDIAGFPHYENVCSNILAFYFDNNKPHGFGDLLVRSLLDILGFDTIKDERIEVSNVIREASTSSGKRIDIIIETGTHVICIENKIYAELYNDLLDYAEHMDKEYGKTNKEIILLVLSLTKINKSSLSSGFANLTHSDFIDSAKKHWGQYILKANPKYSIYLSDFFSTILKFTERMPVNSEMRRFLLENRQEVNSLIDSWYELQGEIGQQVKDLGGLVGPLPLNVRQWIYGKYDLVHDFTMPDNIIIAVDCWVYIDGFRIRVWLRKGSKGNNEHSYLNKLVLFNKDYSEFANKHSLQDVDWNSGVRFPAGFSVNDMAVILTEVLQGIRFTEEVAELSTSSGTQENNLIS